MGGFSITRRIGIDMGHRVPTHGSKCWNLHGHRYEILATAVSVDGLQGAGEQTDMVLDFGFLKDAMMAHIDRFCDHGLVLWNKDPWKDRFIQSWEGHQYVGDCEYYPSIRDEEQTKLLLVPFIPTAERLAEFWFKSMQESVYNLSNAKARLLQLQVFETPNGDAVYPVDQAEALSYEPPVSLADYDIPPVPDVLYPVKPATSASETSDDGITF